MTSILEPALSASPIPPRLVRPPDSTWWDYERSLLNSKPWKYLLTWSLKVGFLLFAEHVTWHLSVLHGMTEVVLAGIIDSTLVLSHPRMSSLRLLQLRTAARNSLETLRILARNGWLKILSAPSLSLLLCLSFETYHSKNCHYNQPGSGFLGMKAKLSKKPTRPQGHQNHRPIRTSKSQVWVQRRMGFHFTHNKLGEQNRPTNPKHSHISRAFIWF